MSAVSDARAVAAGRRVGVMPAASPRGRRNERVGAAGDVRAAAGARSAVAHAASGPRQALAAAGAPQTHAALLSPPQAPAPPQQRPARARGHGVTVDGDRGTW
ncbi:hypothetical protein SBI_07871 [Streptomyces bingchenggensis BCW-1]|uniref:Uncharacterized protein n=1 Tax=Streptomyces bingchenggensis (strain BCW-1) TaxID=749414 RepID=D7CEW9_STRBB|nr:MULTISPECIES: hypothetical protein [Streptomyces]ADI10991.1 hypothetical protein SBI_07871 [Streptomyces bingchenggensis BCW-1]